MLRSASISTRNQFSSLLNDRNLKGIAVEVGTHRGDFAKVFLDVWEGKRLYCIDPWKSLPEYKYQEKFLWGGSEGNRSIDMAHTRAVLHSHRNRVQLVRDTSNNAVCLFGDNTLDFVYLDGNHEPPYVEEDIRIWWPKIKHGGILAGHDFLCPGEADGSWGRYIQPAVLKFVVDHPQSMDVHLVVEEGGLPWSYYILKP